MISKSFKDFCKEIEFDYSTIKSSVNEITKKLNKVYYDIDDDSTHSYLVGSLGRGTGVKGCSDVDLIFDLPKCVYNKYNNYKYNGPSQLLQEIKNVLLERYPRTDIKGDGQVVVIEFDKYTIELVPAFRQNDSSFLYPDTHDNGSWKKTDPLSEQLAVDKIDTINNGNYRQICRLLRMWKNQNGINIGGLLIDTLCYSVFKSTSNYSNVSYEYYYSILTDIFDYIRNQNKKQSYWFAPGSNQHVNSSDNSFINKATEAYDLMSSSNSDDEKENSLVSLFGNKFPHEKRTSQTYKDTEEFIEDLYSIDIRYDLKIDCKVTQKGFRDFFLRTELSRNFLLKHNKDLEFQITNTNAPSSCNICWKVRNVGPIAEKKNMIRGQIQKTNRRTHKEHTSFSGTHFVECYLIINNTCVARDKIKVPIGTC